MRQVFFTGEEAQECSPLLGDVVANRSLEHRIAHLQRVEHRALGHWVSNIKLNFAADARQSAQVLWQHDPNHGNVCVSTDSTAGRSWTIAFQLSPASFEAYTCPPVVPKYTPQESSLSTAIASRNTFT